MLTRSSYSKTFIRPHLHQTGEQSPTADTRHNPTRPALGVLSKSLDGRRKDQREDTALGEQDKSDDCNSSITFHSHRNSREDDKQDQEGQEDKAGSDEFGGKSGDETADSEAGGGDGEVVRSALRGCTSFLDDVVDEEC